MNASGGGNGAGGTNSTGTGVISDAQQSGTYDAIVPNATEASGGGGAHNNLQPSAVMLKIIKT